MRTVAFGVNEDICLRIVPAFFQDHVGGDAFVYTTISMPEFHFPSGNFPDPGSQVFVRYKQDLTIWRNALYDFQGIGRSAANIRPGLHFGCRVDVTYNNPVRIGFFPFPQFITGNAFSQWTSGSWSRNQDLFVRRNDRCGLGHKMHTAKNDNPGIRFPGFLG